MPAEKDGFVPAIESVFHPSDFSVGSEVAFAHALKIALSAKTELDILHVSPEVDVQWMDFPGVRNTLERWGLLPSGSKRDAVSELGISVRKILAPHKDPVKSALAFLEKHPTDLVVLATHQHDRRMHWLRKAVAEPLARAAGQMTLFLPHAVDGFVSLEDGSVSLKNIVIPIDKHPRPQPALEAARRACIALGVNDVTITLVYIGAQGDMPAVQLPDQEGWTWHRRIEQGQPVNKILEVAAQVSADLIIMTTAGPNGFLDALRGSTTERVLQGAQCPLLAIPAGWERIWDLPRSRQF